MGYETQVLWSWYTDNLQALDHYVRYIPGLLFQCPMVLFSAEPSSQDPRKHVLRVQCKEKELAYNLTYLYFESSRQLKEKTVKVNRPHPVV